MLIYIYTTYPNISYRHIKTLDMLGLPASTQTIWSTKDPAPGPSRQGTRRAQGEAPQRRGRFGERKGHILRWPGIPIHGGNDGGVYVYIFSCMYIRVMSNLVYLYMFINTYIYIYKRAHHHVCLFMYLL